MSRTARAQGFSRRHRFTARGSFAAALRGTRKLRGDLVVLHVVPRRGEPSRLGIAVTRRMIPASTDRNRVKRIARDTFRAHAAKAAGVDCVIALRRAIPRASEAAFRLELQALLDQLCARAMPS
jgi:ribonuclease P protein component